MQIEMKDSLQLHFSEVSAVAMRSSKYISCGRDGIVKLCKEASVFEFAPLPSVAFTSVAFLDASYVVVGDVTGSLYVLSAVDLHFVEKVTNAHSIEMLSVGDQQGVVLAVASLQTITIYKWDSKRLKASICLPR